MSYRPKVDRNAFGAAFPPGFGWMLWHYTSPHEPGELTEPGYFDELAPDLRPGDWIAVNCPRADGVGYDPRMLIVQETRRGAVVVGECAFVVPLRRAA